VEFMHIPDMEQARPERDTVRGTCGGGRAIGRDRTGKGDVCLTGEGQEVVVVVGVVMVVCQRESVWE
jgi:hypothetical protein